MTAANLSFAASIAAKAARFCLSILLPCFSDSW